MRLDAWVARGEMLKSGCAVAAATLLAASPFGVHAQTWDRLPVLPHIGDDFAAHPRRQLLVDGLRVGQVRITFETTRWSDLLRRLGPLRMRRQGEGAETEDWTCFPVGPAPRRVQIWPDGGELTGGEFIDGVTAVAGTPWPLSECPLVDPGPGPIVLNSGAWIGATRASTLKRLGRPTAIHDPSITYDFSVPVRDRRLGKGAAGGRIIFEIKANRVVRLTANKDTAF
jgi:hypothetical protein